MPFINRSAALMLGTSIDELIGRPLHSIIHDPEMAALPLDSCPVCSAARHPTRRSGTASFVTFTGTPFPIEYTTSSIRDDDVRGGAVVTFRDVTERLAVERMKDEFISTVSHELRTPLTSIRGALGLLGSGLLGDVGLRANRMLEIAVTNTDRLVRLINDILDLEKGKRASRAFSPRGGEKVPKADEGPRSVKPRLVTSSSKNCPKKFNGPKNRSCAGVIDLPHPSTPSTTYDLNGSLVRPVHKRRSHPTT